MPAAFEEINWVVRNTVSYKNTSNLLFVSPLAMKSSLDSYAMKRQSAEMRGAEAEVAAWPVVILLTRLTTGDAPRLSHKNTPSAGPRLPVSKSKPELALNAMHFPSLEMAGAYSVSINADDAVPFGFTLA